MRLLPQHEKFPPLNFTGWVLVVSAVILFAGNISSAFSTLSEHGSLPIKPRDITLGLTAIISILMWMHKPAFAPAAAALMIIPIIRVLDASLLRRFTHEALGDHSVFLLGLTLILLVSIMAVLSMATEHGKRIALWSSIAVILIDSGSLIYESMGYAVYTSIPGRVSGFLRQPNDAIMVMNLMIGCVFTLNKNFWLNGLMIAIASVGVVLTLSRSGMLVFGVLVAVYLVLNLRAHGGKIALVAAITVPVAAAGLAWFIETASSAKFGMDVNVKNRIEAIFGGDTDKMGSDERMKDLSDGWEAVGQAPMIGHGTGCSSSKWEPHNQWVAIWLDIGVGGVILYGVTLLLITAGSVFKMGKGAYAIIPLWLLSVFSQNLVEMTVYWFAASVAVYEITDARFRLSLRRPQAVAPSFA